MDGGGGRMADEAYSGMEMLSRPATEAMVHAAQVTPGMHVLDLASGTENPRCLQRWLSLQRAPSQPRILVPEMLAATEDQARQPALTNIHLPASRCRNPPVPRPDI